MIHYSCDLCGKACNDKKFLIPIAVTSVEEEVIDLMPVEMNLCSECRRSLYKTVEQIVPKDKLKKLNELALNKKLTYNVKC